MIKTPPRMKPKSLLTDKKPHGWVGPDEDYPKLVVFLTPKAQVALTSILESQPPKSLVSNDLDQVLTLLKMKS